MKINRKTPKLVVITEGRAVRYVDGSRDQIAEIDWTTDIRQIRREIESFRVNGMKE
jgi:hypothetical protein